jgi:nucleoid-associated protein YgaU
MSQQTLTVTGGTLFGLAERAYGDATQWNIIAAANGIIDPWIVGTVTLIVPPADPGGGNGGILGQ